MNITFTARHFTLKPEMKEYMNEKCQKLTRFSENIQDVDVILGFENQNKNTELKIRVSGSHVVIRESSDDLRKSFDQAVDKAERQLKKHESRASSTNQDRHRSA